MQVLSFSALENLALDAPVIVSAAKALEPRKNIHVIAEIKRASPSRGRMASIDDPEELARIYETSGASAISVLTEQRKFLGSLSDLQRVRNAVAISILRKDFIATEYQILEARAFGANMVLLIAAGLERKRLEQLKNFAEEIELTVFVETHNLDEVKIAVDIDSKLIGINARDLSTFETDRKLFELLANSIPSNITKVAESAVRNVDDVEKYRNTGADAVLVGEALVTGDAASLIQSFLSV